MTWEQYWYGDVRMAQDFLRAYEMRKKREYKEANRNAHLQGFYVYQAVGRLAPILRTSFSKRRVEPEPYMDEPLELFAQDKDQMTEQEQEAQEERELQFARAYMMQMDMAGKNWGKE